jgi:glycine cleavage system transcriptional repressor
MERKFILTAFGLDRPGIVADVTGLIYEHGCNLEDTTMTLLAGEFTLIVLLTAPNDAASADIADRLLASCRRLEKEKGLSAFVREVESLEGFEVGPHSPHTIRVEGMDQAGIVYKISRFLADSGVNIIDLKSKRQFMAQSGTALYLMEIQVQVPKTLSLDILDQGLNRIGGELNVEISW